MSGLERANPAGGVQELSETHRRPVPHRPDVDEGDVELLAGALRDTAVAPEANDLVAGVEELRRDGRELVPPLLVERVEDVAPHVLEAVVRTAVRQALRLLPLDVRVH